VVFPGAIFHFHDGNRFLPVTDRCAFRSPKGNGCLAKTSCSFLLFVRSSSGVHPAYWFLPTSVPCSAAFDP